MSALQYLGQIIKKTEVDIPQSNLNGEALASAMRMAFAIAGGIAVIMITLAAFKYVISMGDPQATAKAKNGIMYSVLGLLISLVGVGIVTFVLGKI